MIMMQEMPNHPPEALDPSGGHMELTRAFFASFMELVLKSHFQNHEEILAQVEKKVVPMEVEPGLSIDVSIFRPKTLGDSKDNSAMIYGHGGGGTMMSPDCWAIYIAEMCLRLNTVIIAPNYRKAPEHKQPIGANDMRAATKHFHANAAEFGFNQDRMSILGISGGALVVLGALN